MSFSHETQESRHHREPKTAHDARNKAIIEYLFRSQEFQSALGISSGSLEYLNYCVANVVDKSGNTLATIFFLDSNVHTIRWKVTVYSQGEEKVYFLKTWPTQMELDSLSYEEWSQQLVRAKELVDISNASLSGTCAKFARVLNFGIVPSEIYSTCWVLMEYVDGISLDKIESPISGTQACQLLLEVLKALVPFQQKCVLHRDIAPRNIMVILSDTRDIEQIFIVDPDLIKPMSAVQGGTHLTPRLEHALAYYGTTLVHERERRTADGYALGITILQLLTGLAPEIIREKITDKRFWIDLHNRVSETCSREEAEVFVFILKRLTDTNWNKRIQDYQTAVDCLEQRRKLSAVKLALQAVRIRLEDRFRKRRNKPGFSLENLDVQNLYQYRKEVLDLYQRDPQRVVDRLTSLARALHELTEVKFHSLDAERETLCSALAQITPHFSLLDRGKVLSNFFEVEELQELLLPSVANFIRQTKEILQGPENMTQHEWQNLLEMAERLTFMVLESPYRSRPEFTEIADIAISGPWLSTRVLDKLWRVAISGALDMDFLLRLIDRVFDQRDLIQNDKTDNTNNNNLRESIGQRIFQAYRAGQLTKEIIVKLFEKAFAHHNQTIQTLVQESAQALISVDDRQALEELWQLYADASDKLKIKCFEVLVTNWRQVDPITLALCFRLFLKEMQWTSDTTSPRVEQSFREILKDCKLSEVKLQVLAALYKTLMSKRKDESHDVTLSIVSKLINEGLEAGLEYSDMLEKLAAMGCRGVFDRTFTSKIRYNKIAAERILLAYLPFIATVQEGRDLAQTLSLNENDFTRIALLQASLCESILKNDPANLARALGEAPANILYAALKKPDQFDVRESQSDINVYMLVMRELQKPQAQSGEELPPWLCTFLAALSEQTRESDYIEIFLKDCYKKAASLPSESAATVALMLGEKLGQIPPNFLYVYPTDFDHFFRLTERIEGLKNSNLLGLYRDAASLIPEEATPHAREFFRNLCKRLHRLLTDSKLTTSGNFFELKTTDQPFFDKTEIYLPSALSLLFQEVVRFSSSLPVTLYPFDPFERHSGPVTLPLHRIYSYLASENLDFRREVWQSMMETPTLFFWLTCFFLFHKFSLLLLNEGPVPRIFLQDKDLPARYLTNTERNVFSKTALQALSQGVRLMLHLKIPLTEGYLIVLENYLMLCFSTLNVDDLCENVRSYLEQNPEQCEQCIKIADDILVQIPARHPGAAIRHKQTDLREYMCLSIVSLEVLCRKQGRTTALGVLEEYRTLFDKINAVSVNDPYLKSLLGQLYTALNSPN